MLSRIERERSLTSGAKWLQALRDLPREKGEAFEVWNKELLDAGHGEGDEDAALGLVAVQPQGNAGITRRRARHRPQGAHDYTWRSGHSEAVHCFMQHAPVSRWREPRAERQPLTLITGVC